MYIGYKVRVWVCACVRVRWWPCAAAGGADLATRRVEADADAGV